MAKVVGIRFKKAGKIYYFLPGSLDIKPNDGVIVETVRGMEYGKAVISLKEISEEEVVSPLKEVLRLATPEDEEIYQNNEKKEKEAFQICLKKIHAHQLPMKLIDVEYTFDGNKIIFLLQPKAGWISGNW